MKTIFEVSVALNDRRYRQKHYPSYPICWHQIMLATSIEVAERFVKSCPFDKQVLMYSVREKLINVGHYGSDCLTERIYDLRGELIDRRMFSTIFEAKNSKFYGRKQSEIRFSKGEIVEVIGGGEAHLAFVVGLPLTEEEAQEIYRKAAADGYEDFTLDWTDDFYTVLTNHDYASHEHVDGMNLIKPSFKVSARVAEHLSNEFSRYSSNEEQGGIGL